MRGESSNWQSSANPGIAARQACRRPSRFVLARRGEIVVAIPPFTSLGDLPLGVHLASLPEVLKRFAAASGKRAALGLRLERIHALAQATGQVRRFVVFGSFVTAKAEPNDVDVFLVMDDSFDPALVTAATRRLFDHSAAQGQFGASVFWLRCLACLEGEQAAVEYWQVKRGGGSRGIVEIIAEEP
jgi:hypothetical protein